jgi:predicted lipoprotein with Yx(FWY)xxD motif
VTAVVALTAAGCGASGSQSVPTTPAVVSGIPSATGRAEVRSIYLAEFKAQVLVTGAGDVLYMFVPDRRARVTCTGTCAALWPPLDVPKGAANVTASGQVRPGLLGADADPATGQRVVTYGGWPLYTYQADFQAGYATGQGVDLDGGYWYLMSPTGSPIVPAGDPQPA